MELTGESLYLLYRSARMAHELNAVPWERLGPRAMEVWETMARAINTGGRTESILQSIASDSPNRSRQKLHIEERP